MKRTPKELTKLAEVALDELRLSATTEADRARCDRVWQGLRSLDEEQAEAKEERDTLAQRVKKLEGALRKALDTQYPDLLGVIEDALSEEGGG